MAAQGNTWQHNKQFSQAELFIVLPCVVSLAGLTHSQLESTQQVRKNMTNFKSAVSLLGKHFPLSTVPYHGHAYM